MTSEQIKKLSEWEGVFTRALKLNFLHLSQGEFNEIMEVYVDFFPPLNRSQMNCGSCRLTAVKKLGELYFKEKDNPVKSKRGRKPKIENNAENGEGAGEE